MINRIDDKIRKLKEKNEVGLIALSPIEESIEKSMQIADTLVNSGVDILMVHIPNCIPWMEGTVLQKAARKSREKGVTRTEIFEFTKKLRDKYPELPLVFMTLYDTVMTIGQEKFIEEALKTDVDGFDIPNYPLTYIDDSLGFYEKTLEINRHLILAISYELAVAEKGTKEYELLLQIVKNGRGFVFVMNAPGGKSGADNKLTEDQLKEAVTRVKTLLDKEGNLCTVSVVCGISTQDDVKKVLNSGAETFMIGSAYIEYLQEGKKLDHVYRYLKNIKSQTLGERMKNK